MFDRFDEICYIGEGLYDSEGADIVGEEFGGETGFPKRYPEPHTLSRNVSDVRMGFVIAVLCGSLNVKRATSRDLAALFSTAGGVRKNGVGYVRRIREERVYGVHGFSSV